MKRTPYGYRLAVCRHRDTRALGLLLWAAIALASAWMHAWVTA